MIVEMQKLTLMIANKYSDDALRKLRKLGVVHIEHLHPPHAEGITAIERRLDELEKALVILWPFNTPQKEDSGRDDAAGYIKNVLTRDREREKLQKRGQDLQNDLDWFKEWGDVAALALTELNQAGVYIKLYSCSRRFLKTIDKEKTVHILSEKGSNVKIALVSRSADAVLELPAVSVPQANLHSVRRKIASTQEQLSFVNEQLADLAGQRDYLDKCKKDLLKRLDFFKVKFGMAHEEVFSCLQGFCPKDTAGSIKDTAENEGWGYLLELPDDIGQVPTLIKNPKWLQIINPVFKFMGTLPRYGEIDISFWFLLFLSLFFAMLIGDAGYGIIFLITTFFARRKFAKADAAIFFLLGTLSCATILWGAITGTWFGVEKIAQLPFFSCFVIDKMNSFVDANQGFMMYLCFLVGIIQLTIAHGIKALRYINSVIALSEIGWIGILWGLFFIIGKFVLNKPLPVYFSAFMAAAAGLVILFSHPRRNIIKGSLIALGMLPLSVINSFADILSYLRLFVIGYVSVMVAASFNAMAMRVGFNNVISGMGAGLILFFGHALNIVLGLLSVLVHGIRLNMLEFSSHLDIQWQGKEYKPFKE